MWEITTAVNASECIGIWIWEIQKDPHRWAIWNDEHHAILEGRLVQEFRLKFSEKQIEAHAKSLLSESVAIQWDSP